MVNKADAWLQNEKPRKFVIVQGKLNDGDKHWGMRSKRNIIKKIGIRIEGS